MYRLDVFSALSVRIQLQPEKKVLENPAPKKFLGWGGERKIIYLLRPGVFPYSYWQFSLFCNLCVIFFFCFLENFYFVYFVLYFSFILEKAFFLSFLPSSSQGET